MKEIAKLTEERVTNSHLIPLAQQKSISFVKEGTKPKSSKSKTVSVSYFDGAKDWNLQIDLNKHVKIPKEILETSLRPDLVVTSEKKKMLGKMELTVPYEDQIEVSKEMKRAKYQWIVDADGSHYGTHPTR